MIKKSLINDGAVKKSFRVSRFNKAYDLSFAVRLSWYSIPRNIIAKHIYSKKLQIFRYFVAVLFFYVDK